MDLIEIVLDYLKKNGFDGLFNTESECGCQIDELMPCGEPGIECTPGYKHAADPETSYDFIIGPNNDEKCPRCGAWKTELICHACDGLPE